MLPLFGLTFYTEEKIELFFLCCTPNVLLMTTAVFQLTQKIKISNLFWINTFAKLTKYGFGIYMVHYSLVDPGRMIVYRLHIPIQILVATSITFALAWLFTALVHRLPGQMVNGVADAIAQNADETFLIKNQKTINCGMVI